MFWNYQVKRSPAPAIFTWWLLTLGALLFAPVAVWLTWPVSVPAAGWYCVGGTACFYAGYFSLIALSYNHDDLSRAYPIARGVAPAATAAWGVLFHREHPSLAGWLGIAGISLGVLTLALSSLARAAPGIDPASSATGLGAGQKWVWLKQRRPFWSALPPAGILAAIGTGLCTSGYSAVDKEGVKHVQPALYIVLTFAAGALVLGVQLARHHRWQAFMAEARRGGAGLLLAAALQLGGYLLILKVLRTEPVSYVVPLRSVAVPLSVFAGARWLGETEGVLRFAAAALILAGIAAIALGG